MQKTQCTFGWEFVRPKELEGGIHQQPNDEMKGANSMLLRISIQQTKPNKLINISNKDSQEIP